jgi:hypothetical protein
MTVRVLTVVALWLVWFLGWVVCAFVNVGGPVAWLIGTITGVLAGAGSVAVAVKEPR